ncbi:conserved hypothetical protein [Brugia malayi]|uniref:Bm8776 n=1 Tax=Brugia malayi TaxID=6279 RepID=A0A1P6CE86_BRUMA|nr:uncharacterized protein BM_BM8776 [Brugia malayi]CRZ22777.1 Bm8776 [Brugia malayi]VIP00114.1 conserved hypothetical protein [Brugia malayi]
MPFRYQRLLLFSSSENVILLQLNPVTLLDLDIVPKAILKRAIIRSPWELRHETVIIENKIGEGEFGEVFSGKYKLPWRMR